MKTALKRLQERLRHRRHLAHARRAIARCDRNVARRRALCASQAPARHFFAPGVIQGGPRPARTGLRSYLVTLVVAIAAGAWYVISGGLPS